MIPSLALFIQAREIREKNTHDVDHLLVGKMKLLRALLQKFPKLKFTVGEILTCCFEWSQTWQVILFTTVSLKAQREEAKSKASHLSARAQFLARQLLISWVFSAEIALQTFISSSTKVRKQLLCVVWSIYFTWMTSTRTHHGEPTKIWIGTFHSWIARNPPQATWDSRTYTSTDSSYNFRRKSIGCICYMNSLF